MEWFGAITGGNRNKIWTWAAASSGTKLGVGALNFVRVRVWEVLLACKFLFFVSLRVEELHDIFGNISPIFEVANDYDSEAVALTRPL